MQMSTFSKICREVLFNKAFHSTKRNEKDALRHGTFISKLPTDRDLMGNLILSIWMEPFIPRRTGTDYVPNM